MMYFRIRRRHKRIIDTVPPLTLEVRAPCKPNAKPEQGDESGCGIAMIPPMA